MADDSMAGRRSTRLRQIVAGLMPGWPPETIDAFDYLSDGYSNENFRFEHAGASFVLRVPNRVRPYVDRACELAFYRAGHPVRTAELIAFDPKSGYMITRFEPGSLLAEAMATPEQVVGYVCGLHASLPGNGRRYNPVALARQYLAAGRAPDWIRSLAESLTWAPTVSIPCHNDLNPWNVILPPTGPWVTLDWEWHGDNDPLFDLVTLHQGLGWDDQTLAGMLGGWCAESVDGERLARCLTAFWLREYAWAHAERHFGNVRPEIARQIATAAGRLRALQSGRSRSG